MARGLILSGPQRVETVLAVSSATTADATNALAAATITTTETVFAQNYPVAASFLTTNRVIRIESYWDVVSTAGPTLRLRLRFGGLAGTVLYDSGLMSIPAITNKGAGWTHLVQGTAAAGASVNVQTSSFVQSLAITPTASMNQTAQPVACATNASAVLTWTAQYSAGTAGNVITLQAFVVSTFGG